MNQPELEKYLQSGYFLDFHQDSIKLFAFKYTSELKTPVEKAVALFQAVRDEFRYDPYRIPLKPWSFKASVTLDQGYGFCITKAVLLAAVTRAVGIPARLGFANVRNHLNTEKLQNLMGTDIFYYHGYTELFLDEQWVKATPAFNKSLCERFGFKIPDFDGCSDSRFHSLDSEGKLHMEYLEDHGTFDDLPYEQIMKVWSKHYISILAGNLAAASSGIPDKFSELEN